MERVKGGEFSCDSRSVYRDDGRRGEGDEELRPERRTKGEREAQRGEEIAGGI